MSVVKKNLSGGGDAEFDKITSNANILGVDTIELVWVPHNRLPHYGTIQVSGYQVPIINNSSIAFDEDVQSGTWIDGAVKFFPDDRGVCYALVYDTDVNRDLLASSITNGWYRIVDRRIRDEIFKLAEEKGYSTTVAEVTEIQIKKSIREKNNENHIKELEKKLAEMAEKTKAYEKELEISKGEKVEFIEKKLAGKKLPNRDKIIEG